MKRILLPTDFSKLSVKAIHYALNLYKDIPCHFYVLNVFRIPYLANEELMENNANQLALLEDELFEASRKGIKELLNSLPKNEMHRYSSISDYNLFGNAVKDIIKEKDIELIVMGTKGATGAKEIFMGSNTGDVIMKTNCNVMAIPEHTSSIAPKEICFPTDFQISYDFEDLAPLIKLAEMNDATIRILHMSDKDKLNENQQHNKRKLASFLVNVSHSFFTLSNMNFEEALNCFTQSRTNIDMIAIISGHYNFFQRLFFRPKIQELSFHTKVPLFVLHHLN